MTWTDELRRREDSCRRAPSAHNTQPWILHYAHDEVTVHWDPSRTLPDSDPTQRDLFLSLGAFIETCLIVATDAGLPVHPQITVDETENLAARIRPADRLYPTSFSARDVEQRRCARGRYHPGRVPAEALAETGAVLGATPAEPPNRPPGTGTREATNRLPDASLRELPSRRLAAMLAAADRRMFGTPAVARELRDWLRLSARHPRYRADGLTDRALALSRAEATGLAAALSPAVYTAARRLGLPAALASASRSLLRYDGSVLVLVGRTAEPDQLVEHGRALMRTWLALSRRGLSVHPLSQILDGETTARGLETLLDLEPGESALAVFRAGRPVTEAPRSARLPADQRITP